MTAPFSGVTGKTCVRRAAPMVSAFWSGISTTQVYPDKSSTVTRNF